MNKREARKVALRITANRIAAITGGDVGAYLKKTGREHDAKTATRVLDEVARIQDHLEWEADGRPEK